MKKKKCKFPVVVSVQVLYDAALDVLKSQNQKELFYQFAPALMQFVPKQMVSALISQGRGLSPAKLLPALVNVDDDQVSVLNVFGTCMLNFFRWMHLMYIIFLVSYVTEEVICEIYEQGKKYLF
jgi:hypothetical protein